MKNDTTQFLNLHHPFKGLVFYQSDSGNHECFVEAYDFNRQGRMVDPHPLSLKESQKLAECLMTTPRLSDHYLQPKGLMPDQVLYIRTGLHGFAIWYSPPLRRKLFFVPALGLEDGDYTLPPMIWKATRDELQVFALNTQSKPSLSTQLYQAPFFNVYPDGKVCMGTVDISIDPDSCLESFISKWEDYFFNSKFSHVLGERAPVKGNIISLWKSLYNNPKKFPSGCLQKHHLTISNLIQ